ncbi:MAG TPA: response regulator transcription factor [Bacteroidia bacterium]|nr:response regulator transcription factor [Bacteroidia bacterium]
MKINCIIVEDEPPAAKLMEDNVQRVSFLELCGIFPGAAQAEAFLATRTIDLVFLDIRMPGRSGISLSKMLPKETMVIFTTAYENHALEGFEVNAVDYLLKPFSFERFEQACRKAKELKELRASQAPKKIQVRSSHSIVYLDPCEITHVEGLKDYVKIFVAGNPKPVLSRMNLKGAETILPPAFIRVHKSYIVNSSLITKTGKDLVHLGDILVPVGDAFRQALAEKTGTR